MWLLRVVTACVLIDGLMGSSLSSKPSIIVIGSGPSGIAAATRLLKNNFTDLKILEAENRIGGRINSVKFGDAYVDLGAEFCVGQEGNIVYSMVKDLDVLRHSNNESTFYYSNGEKIDKKIGNKILHFTDSLAPTNKTSEGCENVLSVGECLNIKAKTFMTTAENAKERDIFSNVRDWAYAHLCSYENPLDLNDLRTITTYKECSGIQDMNWNGLGYKTILEVMMQKYPRKDAQLPISNKILFKKEVDNISNWLEGNKVSVRTTDGGIYEADHVIFTPSVGVLKAKHRQLFSPLLPNEKVDAIERIGYGATAKVILRFTDRFWGDNVLWAFIWAEKDKQKLKEKKLDWLVGLNSYVQAENNPKVLIAWYSGSHIPRIESLSHKQLMEGHRHVINTFLAPHFNVSMPVELIRTTWYSNPNFRGTYSYESVKGHSTSGSNFQEKLGSPLRNKVGKPTVLFAGEATHPHYFATVHGAIEAGYREADRLIQLYHN